MHHPIKRIGIKELNKPWGAFIVSKKLFIFELYCKLEYIIIFILYNSEELNISYSPAKFPVTLSSLKYSLKVKIVFSFLYIYGWLIISYCFLLSIYLAISLR